MGNIILCFGKTRRRSNKGGVVVHPLDRGLLDGNGTVDGVSLRRVKVRMTREQLEELMKTASKDGVNNNDSDWLARLVYEECVKGSLHCRVSVVVDSGDTACKKWYRGHSILSPIQEHTDDVVYGE